MIVAAVLLAAGGIAAQRDNPDGAPGPHMICRKIDITGSIMPGRRLCKTREAWEKFDSGNHAKVESINDPDKRGWHTGKGNS